MYCIKLNHHLLLAACCFTSFASTFWRKPGVYPLQTAIVFQMAPGCGGGGGGESSESHDTDPPGDEMDSPPSVRRRPLQGGKTSRPHSDLLNQILIDKFKVGVVMFYLIVSYYFMPSFVSRSMVRENGDKKLRIFRESYLKHARGMCMLLCKTCDKCKNF